MGSNGNDEKYFTGELGDYVIIQTEDGSTTLKSEYFSEVCHSLNGAYAETLHNYLQPNRIIELSKREGLDPLSILEVGFGLGVGVQASFETIAKNCFGTPKRAIHYLALELDEALIKYAIKNTFMDKKTDYFPQLQKMVRYELEEGLILYQDKQGPHSLSVLVGDARKTLKSALDKKIFEPFHAVYQDPFSPRKNPFLWTQEWFELLAQCCAKNATLSTYSASVSPRKAMLSAGFRPHRLKGMGHKREITLAILNGDQDEKLERSLLNSKAPVLRDAEITNYLSSFAPKE